MQRLWIPLALVLCTCLWSGCRVLQVENAGRTGPVDWLTEGDSPERRHATDAMVPPPLEEVWVYKADAGFGPGSPLLLDQTILVPTRKGEVHGIDLTTGRRVGLDNFGEGIEGTPVIHKGLLFVPVAWGGRTLYGYDLHKAQTRWRVKHAPIEAGLLAFDDIVVAADLHGTVRAHAVADGDVVWERVLGDERAVHATPVLAAGSIIVGDDRGDMVALHPADGTLTWTQSLEAPVYASFAAHEGALFIPTTRGRFYSLDAETGRIRWHFATPDTTVRMAAPAVDGSLVVVGASDGVLRAFDTASGTLQWAYDGTDVLAAAPLLTADHVYIGTMGEELIALDRQTGARVWAHTLRGRIKSAMAERDGQLIVLSEPHFVYLFKSAPVSSHVATP